MELAIALSLLVLVGLVLYYTNKAKEQVSKKDDELPLVKLGPEPEEVKVEVKPDPVKQPAKRVRKPAAKPAAKPASKTNKKPVKKK